MLHLLVQLVQFWGVLHPVKFYGRHNLVAAIRHDKFVTSPRSLGWLWLFVRFLDDALTFNPHDWCCLACGSVFFTIEPQLVVVCQQFIVPLKKLAVGIARGQIHPARILSAVTHLKHYILFFQYGH